MKGKMRKIKRFFAVAAALTCIAGAAPAYQAVFTPVTSAAAESAAENSFSSLDEAVDYVRTQLAARNTEITVTVPRDSTLSGGAHMNYIVDKACAETGIPNEGDYIRMGLKGHGGYISGNSQTLTLGINVDYYTDSEQEDAVTKRVASILSVLKLDGKSDYEKVLAVYKWVTANVSYSTDLESDWVFSAYGALSNGSAVCQGYSQLMYRLLMEAGVPCRVVTGTGIRGGSHAWNIVKLDGLWYYLDATYDQGYTYENFDYFLKGTEDFDLGPDKHTPSSGGDSAFPNIEPDYTSAEFAAMYPMALTAYDPAAHSGIVKGDVDLDGKLTAYDMSAMRKGIVNGFASGDAFKAADIDGSGDVKINDLVLLQSFLVGHITRFPA